jgi:heme-degrading monooxygenase HmoA
LSSKRGNPFLGQALSGHCPSGGPAMTDIREHNGVVTQITTVKLPPDNQDEVLNLMIERARFMATQPGFVSVNLHRSKDGSHVVNYIQWTNTQKLEAAHHAPEFRKKWPRFGELANEIEPCLYDVVHIEAA